jgi:hypothetical protein
VDKGALLPADDRAALFGETDAGRGVANTIIKKGFWVCWSLKRLFGLQHKDTVTLVLKGGTPFFASQSVRRHPHRETQFDNSLTEPGLFGPGSERKVDSSAFEAT